MPDIEPKIRKKYVLSKLPKGLFGGTPVRLGYVTVTKERFRFHVEGKRNIISLVNDSETDHIEVNRDVYDLLVYRQTCHGIVIS
jgi:hypothetical protein